MHPWRAPEAGLAIYIIVFTYFNSKGDNLMRCALQITIPAEAGNAAFKSGKLAEVIAAFVEKWRPEAAYFFPRKGQRASLFVVNVDDPSQVPSLVEPFFMGLNAEVELTPVMTFEDLKKGMGAMEKEARR
jgi:hypothetical protein